MDDILSIFELILNAGLVVQMIMLFLVLMSIYSWTIIFSRKKILIDANSDIKSFKRDFDKNIENTYNRIFNKNTKRSIIENIFINGYNELGPTDKKHDVELSYRAMNTTSYQAIDTLEKDLNILAMIASSSPYIGLFGTVWGIMHSFIGLASVKQATIAIVAPGIAEALIATAFGLFAAIPATMAYNRLSSQVSVIANQYNIFIEEFFLLFQKK